MTPRELAEWLVEQPTVYVRDGKPYHVMVRSTYHDLANGYVDSIPMTNVRHTWINTDLSSLPPEHQAKFPKAPFFSLLWKEVKDVARERKDIPPKVDYLLGLNERVRIEATKVNCDDGSVFLYNLRIWVGKDPFMDLSEGDSVTLCIPPKGSGWASWGDSDCSTILDRQDIVAIREKLMPWRTQIKMKLVPPLPLK